MRLYLRASCGLRLALAPVDRVVLLDALGEPRLLGEGPACWCFAGDHIRLVLAGGGHLDGILEVGDVG